MPYYRQNKIVLVIGDLEDDHLWMFWLVDLCRHLRQAGSMSVAVFANQGGASAIGVDLTVKLPAAVEADEVIATMASVCHAVKSVEHLYQMIGIDCNDFIAFFEGCSYAWIARGFGSGTRRAQDAAAQVVAQIRALHGANSSMVAVSISICGPVDLRLQEINDICLAVQEATGNETEIIFNAVKDRDDERVEVICLCSHSKKARC